jgi:hypothetical protein
MVLVAGGYDNQFDALAIAEIYDPTETLLSLMPPKRQRMPGDASTGDDLMR